MSINKATMLYDEPSLIDLPSELILHIIGMLPHSPYYKRLSVCKRLNAIENEFVVERSAMCICRLHEHVPNLPKYELKLLLCMHPRQHQLNTLIKIIKKRPATCKVQVMGVKRYIKDFQNYLKHSADHPNVKMFLENCETNITSPSKSDQIKSIDLRTTKGNNLEAEFHTDLLELDIGKDQNLIQQFSNILPGSCFSRVIIDCNSINFRFFLHCLKNYCHIFDILDFQRKISSMKIKHITSMPIQVNFLSDFHNLDQLFFMINEVDLENIKSRLLELVQCFNRANFKKLHSFILYENSPLIYLKDFIPTWINLLNTIPSQKLELLEIRSQTDENQLTTRFESPNSLSLVNGIARFDQLESLTIHHFGFDTALIKILPSLCRLKKLDLHINMDISKKSIIKELCHNLEKCNNLEDIAIHVPPGAIMMLGNIFVSLAKIQRFCKIRLYFNSLEETEEDGWLERLNVLQNLREIHLHIKRNEFNQTYYFHRACNRLQEKITTFFSKHCVVSVSSS